MTFPHTYDNLQTIIQTLGLRIQNICINKSYIGSSSVSCSGKIKMKLSHSVFTSPPIVLMIKIFAAKAFRLVNV